jgi:hypothetical protein
LQRGSGTLLGGGDGGISFPERRQHLDGQLLQPPFTLGPFTTALRGAWDAASLAACLLVCLPITAFLIHKDSHSPTAIPAGRAVIPPRRRWNDLPPQFRESRTLEIQTREP